MDDFNFDLNFKKLEEIVKKLESGKESLEENVKLYEEGMLICKKCKENLKQAQLKIEYINNEVDRK